MKYAALRYPKLDEHLLVGSRVFAPLWNTKAEAQRALNSDQSEHDTILTGYVVTVDDGHISSIDASEVVTMKEIKQAVRSLRYLKSKGWSADSDTLTRTIDETFVALDIIASQYNDDNADLAAAVLLDAVTGKDFALDDALLSALVVLEKGARQDNLTVDLEKLKKSKKTAPKKKHDKTIECPECGEPASAEYVGSEGACESCVAEGYQGENINQDRPKGTKPKLKLPEDPEKFGAKVIGMVPKGLGKQDAILGILTASSLDRKTASALVRRATPAPPRKKLTEAEKAKRAKAKKQRELGKLEPYLAEMSKSSADYVKKAFKKNLEEGMPCIPGAGKDVLSNPWVRYAPKMRDMLERLAKKLKAKDVSLVDEKDIEGRDEARIHVKAQEGTSLLWLQVQVKDKSPSLGAVIISDPKRSEQRVTMSYHGGTKTPAKQATELAQFIGWYMTANGRNSDETRAAFKKSTAPSQFIALARKIKKRPEAKPAPKKAKSAPKKARPAPKKAKSAPKKARPAPKKAKPKKVTVMPVPRLDLTITADPGDRSYPVQTWIEGYYEQSLKSPGKELGPIPFRELMVNTGLNSDYLHRIMDQADMTEFRKWVDFNDAPAKPKAGAGKRSGKAPAKEPEIDEVKEKKMMDVTMNAFRKIAAEMQQQ